MFKKNAHKKLKQAPQKLLKNTQTKKNHPELPKLPKRRIYVQNGACRPTVYKSGIGAK